MLPELIQSTATAAMPGHVQQRELQEDNAHAFRRRAEFRRGGERCDGPRAARASLGQQKLVRSLVKVRQEVSHGAASKHEQMQHTTLRFSVRI